MALRVTLALTLILGFACGDDGGGDIIDGACLCDAPNQPDAVPGPDAAACSADLAPADDDTPVTPDLILSEIDPGNFIELYNNTDAPISLAGVAHQLCSPFAYRALSVEAPNVTVPPRGRAMIPWPSNFADTDAAGEMMLYKSANFTNGDDILDFVCWGPVRTPGRKIQAEGVGKWDMNAPCADPLPSGGSIERNVGSDGTDAASYTGLATPSGENCE